LIYNAEDKFIRIIEKRENQMNHKEIIDSIAYCGLVCALDSCFENCNGCKSGTGCGDDKCVQRECCIIRGLNGCWECDDFPCGKGYFANEETSKGQFIGCVRYIKEFGFDKLVERIISNQHDGIKYGLGGDYANKSETEVIRLLHKE
jgi:hypothetical protein